MYDKLVNYLLLYQIQRYRYLKKVVHQSQNQKKRCIKTKKISKLRYVSLMGQEMSQ